MLLLDDYIQLLEAPLSVDASHIKDLQRLLEYAPYCASARLLLLKAQYDAGDMHYLDHLERTILAAPPQSSVYFLLKPKKVKRTTRARKRNEATQSYFEMIEKMRQVAQDSGISFEELTQRYISTREYIK